MGNKNGQFIYTYSAKQQEEVERIRQKYVPQEENKMELLRRLDRDATKPGTMASIIVGIIGTLLLGIGMTCTLVWQDYFLPGIVVGVIGIVGVAMAYPIFICITKKQRKRIAPQIMKLTEELMEKK